MKSKLKVSTKACTHQKRIEKIVNVMRGFPNGISPKTLAFYTGINQNTVKSILKKLESEGRVNKIPYLRGMYILVENNTHSILLYCLQNVVLRFKSDKIRISRYIEEVNNLNDLIKFRFQIGKESNQATMHISTDYPFNITALGILAHLFQEKIIKHCNVEPELNQIEVATFEINKDYYNYKFEGIKSITLDNLITEFKIYQKKKRIREEFKIKVPVTFDLINKILQQGLVSAEVFLKFNKQNKEISKLDERMHNIERVCRGLFQSKLNKE